MEFIEANDIEHADVIISHFGYWPSFRDAEIISMKFASDEGGLASMEMKILAFEATDKLKDRSIELTKHCVIDIQFIDLAENTINGINHQNILAGLRFGKRERFLVCKLNGAHGASGYIEATTIRIHKLTLGIGSSI